MPAGKVVDAKSTPASSTCENIWLYGYDPKLKTVGPTPNGLPFLEVLACGEVRWMFFQLTSLIAALRISCQTEQVTLASLKGQVMNLTEDKLNKLKSDGCVMHTVVQCAWQTVYVPAGWYTAEECIKGILVYGCRRTMVIKTPESHDQYEALTGVYRASDNAGHKHMEGVLAFMGDD